MSNKIELTDDLIRITYGGDQTVETIQEKYAELEGLKQISLKKRDLWDRPDSD